MVSLLADLHLVLNTTVEKVIALRWRGGTTHSLHFMVFVLLKIEMVDSLVVVNVMVFVEVALIGEMLWIVLTPLWSKWLDTGCTLLVLTPVPSRLFAHVLVFEFQVGDLKNVWLIDSDSSRHMTGDKGWFSSLIPMVSKTYITLRDNGRGRVLLDGEIKVSDKVILRRADLVQTLGFNLLIVSHLFDEGFEVLFRPRVFEFWILEGTLFAWSFLRVKCSELIFLSLLVWSIVSWRVLRVSCGSGIGSWVT
jgi:hypothetical protein